MTQLLRRVGESSTTVSRPEEEPEIEGSNNHEDPDGMIFPFEWPFFQHTYLTQYRRIPNKPRRSPTLHPDNIRHGSQRCGKE